MSHWTDRAGPRAASLLLGCALLGLAPLANAQGPKPVPPSEPVSRLLRDVDRAESVRSVKALQIAYAQYDQAGLWGDMGALFSARGTLSDGHRTVVGGDRIGAYLRAAGGGRDGIAAGDLNVHLALNPIIHVDADGRHAKGRWHVIAMTGRSGGRAEWAAGVMDNDYVRESGTWKIARLAYTPQAAGSYADGWSNLKQHSPVVPYRFTAAEAGSPVAPMGAAEFLPPPEGDQRPVLAGVVARIGRLEDENAVRNLQNAYGYYVSQKMWDDATDLLSPSGSVLLAGAGEWTGRSAVRRFFETMGPAGLKHGELNNHAILDVAVTLSPDGRTARARGFEWNFLGDGTPGHAWWQFRLFENDFEKNGTTWVISRIRLLPVMKADYDLGWGKSAILDPVPAGTLAPTSPAAPLGKAQYVPLLPLHPVTGRPVSIPADARSPWETATVPAGPGAAVPQLTIQQANLALRRAAAFDALENISSAFGDYLTDHQAVPVADLFHDRGMREGPFSGFFVGKEKIRDEELVDWGREPAIRDVIRTHLRLQPVIQVSPDGRSAKLRSWLLLWPSAYGRSLGFYDGMYQDEAVFEDGRWKFWSVVIDDIYFQARTYKDGWSRAKDPAQSAFPDHVPTTIVNIYPPDMSLKLLGRREEGLRGGPGKTIEWPSIKPMWFAYKNPVTGREPPLYWPDCVTCTADPSTSLTANGYPW